MVNLPTELVIRILELSYLAEDGCPDQFTLKSASLVCTGWRDPAQQLLFRSGIIYRHKAEDVERLKEIFEGNPSLGSYVRSISISAADKSFLQKGAFTGDELIRILPFFPQLYHLHFYSFNPASDNNVVFSFELYEDILPRHVRSLTFATSATDSELLYYFLFLWPGIEFLTIAGVSLHVLPITRPDFHLKQLTYNDPPPLTALSWLVPTHTLRYLHLTAGFDQYEGDREITHAFLEREGEYLRSLRIYSIDGPNLLLLELCPNLEELDVEFMDCQSRLPDNMIEALPKSLEHLHVRDIIASGRTELCTIVRVLPRLRVLTVPVGIQSSPHSLYKEDATSLEQFQEDCSRRGVEIVYEAPQKSPLVSLSSYSSFLRSLKVPGFHQEDDPVDVERFPRGRSVHNYALMTAR